VIDETLPWLTFPPAVDLSNTIVVTPRGDIDLLTTDEQLDVWIAAERGRIASVDAAAGRLDDVRALRADLRALLYAYAQGRPLPGPPGAASTRSALPRPHTLCSHPTVASP
jgi:Putative stress-induced transcription regulator